MTADRAQVRRELAAELKDRMDRAEATLLATAHISLDDFVLATRIRGKADGVGLARSYVEEILRETEGGS